MAEVTTSEKKQIWQSFAQALGADLREAKSVSGVSGLEHPVQALAVDEGAKRVIIVSAEANARVAALMQVDVQAAMPDARVLVARPIIVDIGVVGRRLFAGLPPRISVAKINEFAERQKGLNKEESETFYKKYFADVFEPISLSFKNAAIPTASQVVSSLDQVFQLDWGAIGDSIKDGSSGGEIDLSSLYNIDTTAIDRAHGVCPIPLYEFNEADWDLLLTPGRVDELRARLSDLDILQYFFPSADQVALGLADKGIASEKEIIRAVSMSPELGHPFSSPEIVPSLLNFTQSVEALRDAGHVVDGEYGIELTDSGANIRANVKFRPKEGFVSKLLGRFNLNVSVSPKDFLGS